MSAVSPVPAPKPADPATAAANAAALQSAALQVAKTAQRQRLKRLVRSALLWVVLPTLIATLYFGFVAPDEYESSAVVVLSNEDASRHGVMLSEYLQSRDALLAMETSVHFSEHYQKSGGAFGELSGAVGTESRFRNYLARTGVALDARTGVLRVRARAYSGESARVFTQALLDAGSQFLAEVDQGDQPVFTVVARPRAPSDSTYPHRGYAILTTLFAAIAVFAIGSLLIAAVREHAHF